jgi:L-iditol 2-dehydrogenase
MRAIVVTAPGRVELLDRPAPRPGAGEVVVEVGAATVCHTDSYLLAGTHPAAAYPVVPGHEIAGVVCAVGKGVTGVREGDVVAVQTLLGCGRCEWCLRGDVGFCDDCRELGSSLDGGWQEQILVPAELAHATAGLTAHEAALTEPSACAHNAVERADIRAGDIVVVIGPGPIGLLVLQYARLRSPGLLVLVGTPLDERRLELGRSLGADAVVADAPSVEAEHEVLALTHGRGADVVLQCVGSVDATAQALRLAGKDARVVVEGFAGSPAEIGVSPDDLVLRQLTLRGSRGWSLEDFRSALAINGSHAVRVDALISHRFDLAEHDAALAAAFDPASGAIKVAFSQAADR